MAKRRVSLTWFRPPTASHAPKKKTTSSLPRPSWTKHISTVLYNVLVRRLDLRLTPEPAEDHRHLSSVLLSSDPPNCPEIGWHTLEYSAGRAPTWTWRLGRGRLKPDRRTCIILRIRYNCVLWDLRFSKAVMNFSCWTVYLFVFCFFFWSTFVNVNNIAQTRVWKDA